MNPNDAVLWLAPWYDADAAELWRVALRALADVEAMGEGGR